MIVATIILVMKDLVSFNQALADPTRWRIAALVRDEAMCVCELADVLGMPQSTISSHVQILRKAGFLESEKLGKWTYFCIESGLLPLLQEMIGRFEGETDLVWRDDARKAARRLAVREASCCPAPRKLILRKTATPQRSS